MTEVDAPGAGAIAKSIPAAEIGTDCGLFAALSAIVSMAVRGPMFDA